MKTRIIVELKGRFLLVFNSKSNSWGYPGGKLKPPETLCECAARELKEETGLEAHVLVELATKNNTTNYFCREWSGNPTVLEDKHPALGWFDLDNLPSNIAKDFKN
jgi:ADP-ribose pyrophosphatase YjhB (NUDIX family)